MKFVNHSDSLTVLTSLLLLLLLSTSVNQSFGNVAEPELEPQGLYKDSQYVISLNYQTLKPYIYAKSHATLVEVTNCYFF